MKRLALAVLLAVAACGPAWGQSGKIGDVDAAGTVTKVGGTPGPGGVVYAVPGIGDLDRYWYPIEPTVFSNCGQPCLGVTEDAADSVLITFDEGAPTQIMCVIFARVEAAVGKAALLAHEFSTCPVVAVNDSVGPAIWTPFKPAAFETDATPTSPMPRDTIGGGFAEAILLAGGAGGGVAADTTILRRYKNDVMPWEAPQVVYNSAFSWMPRARAFVINVPPGTALKWKVRNVEVYAGAVGVWTETAGTGEVYFHGVVYGRR